jgi:hypothetical protein
VSDRHEDRHLEEAASAIRDADRRHAPAFDSVWAGARQRVDATASSTRRGRLVWAAAGLGAVVTVAALLVSVVPDSKGPSLDAEIELARELWAWEAPTDALNEISVTEILSIVPSLEMTSVPVAELAAPGPITQANGEPRGASP